MNQRGDVERRLKKACLNGTVAELYALIEEDELILDRVSSPTGFFETDTPLHVAVLRGHLEFTKALLHLKRELAIEVDSLRRSALHLASFAGHVEIVEELLWVNSDVCIARDQDGRIPLHLAAMKGRVDVIPKLLEAKPNSIHEKMGRGETILHLSIKYNKLEVLKTLVQYLHSNNKESLLNSRDDDGNTILHLAAALKQMDTIEYLLGIKIVKDQANVKNENGSTALDVVEHCPNRDLKTMEIREILLQASVCRSVCGGLDSKPESPPDNPGGILHCIYWFWIKYFKVDHTWLKEVRGHLITAATLTATMAFQAILSPPGGFWQDSGEGRRTVTPLGDSLHGFWKESGEGPHIAGLAILDSRTYQFRYYHSNSSNINGSSINGSDFNYNSYIPFDYGYSYSDSPLANYLLINTVMLMASLCTIMLALSGFPTDNKLLIWLLTFTVYITISCMGCGYYLAMSLVFPYVFDHYMLPVVGFFVYCWIGLCGFVLVLHTCHFLVWLWNKFANLKWLWNKFGNLEWLRNKLGNLERLWKQFGNLEWLRNKFGYQELVKTCPRSHGPRAVELQP